MQHFEYGNGALRAAVRVEPYEISSGNEQYSRQAYLKPMRRHPRRLLDRLPDCLAVWLHDFPKPDIQSDQMGNNPILKPQVSRSPYRQEKRKRSSSAHRAVFWVSTQYTNPKGGRKLDQGRFFGSKP